MRWWGGRKRLRRGQETAGGALQHQARELVAGVGPGIDADPVIADVGAFGDGMTMHDHLSVIGPGIEKFVADPEHVFRFLFLERRARPDAGVNEQVIPDFPCQLEPGQELQVARRNRGAQRVLDIR